MLIFLHTAVHVIIKGLYHTAVLSSENNGIELPDWHLKCHQHRFYYYYYLFNRNHKKHIAHYIHTHKYSMELLGTYRFTCKH